MKCFSLLMLRRRRCLIAWASVFAVINLIFLWKISSWSEGELELDPSELSFTSKRRSLNHTPPAKPWLSKATTKIDHLSSLQTRKATVPPKRENKEASESHTLIENPNYVANNQCTLPYANTKSTMQS